MNPNKQYPGSLLNLIKTKRLCGSSKNKATVVFDGYPCDPESGCRDTNINAVFSRDETADEVIKRLIERSENRKNIIVVSNDNEIAYFAKQSGAKALCVEDFICPFHDNPSKRIAKENDLSKQDLNYTQINEINKELKKLWL